MIEPRKQRLEGVADVGEVHHPPGMGIHRPADMHFDPESNVVDVHVGNLRRKLSEGAGEQLLSTVRGVGFSLRRDGQTEASASNS